MDTAESIPVFDGFEFANPDYVGQNGDDDQSTNNNGDIDFDQLFIYTTQRGYESCRYRGYSYRICGVTNSRKRWRCRHDKCTGKLWTTRENTNPEERDAHSHPPPTYFDYVPVNADGSATVQKSTDQNPSTKKKKRKIDQPQQSVADFGAGSVLDNPMNTNPILWQLLASSLRANSGAKHEVIDVDDDDERNGNSGSDDLLDYEGQDTSAQHPIDTSDPNYPNLINNFTYPTPDDTDFAIAHEPNPDALEKAESLLSLLGTQPGYNGQRLEKFLSDIVERLAAIKDSMDRGDQSSLRRVIGQFTEIPFLLNKLADKHEMDEGNKKKRKLVNGVLKNMSRDGRESEGSSAGANTVENGALISW